jgi:hypothetical protein
MKSSLVRGWAWLTVVVLVVAGLGGRAIAADNEASTVAYPTGIEQPLPEIAAGGTVVLRGKPPANANVGQPISVQINGFAGNYPAAAFFPPQEWDTGGFNRRFDRSGLTPP